MTVIVVALAMFFGVVTTGVIASSKSDNVVTCGQLQQDTDISTNKCIDKK